MSDQCAAIALSTTRFACHYAPSTRRGNMKDHVYKTIELTGSSSNSSDEAVHNALAKAGKTIRGMRWFQVLESRGHIENNRIDHWQVTVKVGFTLED